MNRSPRRLVPFVLAATVVAGAFGVRDHAAATTPPTTEESAAAPADAFPVTIEHKYGETTIDAEPQRVVSIGFAEHDGLLALGVIPVGVRDWYGEQPFATWIWAQDELGDAEPEVLPSTELNFEQIAALEPDLILGIGSGMSDTDYATLSAIAPTVAQPGEYPDYATPWREQLEIAGRATGRSDVAAEVIAEIEQRFADAREAHPEFADTTAAVAFTFEGEPGGYASQDIRSQVLTELGFTIPAEYDELSGDAFYFTVSAEELATLDADVIVWLTTTAADIGAIGELTLRPTLTAYTEGREVLADPLLSSAFSHSSPLSLEYVLDELVPELALAVDGDPATAVPSAAALDGEAAAAEATATDATAEAGAIEGEDAQAAAEAWSLVFDSNVGYDDKAAHLAEADALQATVDSYTDAGASMGGITLVPTAVTVEGETAAVTYDVYFGDAVSYEGLDGEITLVDGVWTVSREEFCGFMASARNACPAAD